MNTPEYRTLYKYEEIGSTLGFLGVHIQVATKAQFDQVRVENVVYAQAEKIRQTIKAQLISNNPDAQKSAASERAALLACFDGTPIFIEAIPNGYCNDACCAHRPWFIVTTIVGRIKIGWRKRVIEINWNDTVDTKESSDLFASEDVTKDKKLIHAWSYVDAGRYLKAIITSTPVESAKK